MTKTKTKTTKTTTTKAPLITLAVGDWLKGSLVQVLRDKYAMDVEAGQRGADWIVSEGMVRIPEGCILKAVGIRRFGGALGFVCEPKGASPAKAPRATIVGLPD